MTQAGRGISGMLGAALVVVGLVGARPALGCDPAEQARFTEELRQLVSRATWEAAERSYVRLLATGCPLSVQDHVRGADVARQLGLALERVERLGRARALDARPEFRRAIAELEATHGRVHVVGNPKRPPALVRPEPLFDVDARAAVERARTELADRGRFRGMLPAGDYVVGQTPFEVRAGQVEAEIRVGRVKRGALAELEGVDPSKLRYVDAFVALGPALVLSPQTGRVVTLSDGGHQLAPADVRSSGAAVEGGVELGINHREPAFGVALHAGYTVGVGVDEQHALGAGASLVVRPGPWRLVAGPRYQVTLGRGIGVADWFDRGQQGEVERADIPYSGAAWGPGAQAGLGYAFGRVGRFALLVEAAGAWHTDGARHYGSSGLRLGLVPRVPRRGAR